MIRALVVASGAALALSVGGGAAASPPPAEATAAAANTEGAEAFARSLLAQYGSPNAPSLSMAQIYTPTLAALIEADRPRGGDQVGYLDFDPICECQDHGRIVVDRVVLSPGFGGRTWATVTFTDQEAANPATQFLGETRTRRFLLERTAAGWRVADITIDDPVDQGIADALREYAQQAATPNTQ